MNNNHCNEHRVTTALLLAAGTGNRLQPYTDFIPKCLVEINGSSLLERLTDNLCDNGFKRLVIACHPPTAGKISVLRYSIMISFRWWLRLADVRGVLDQSGCDS